MSDREWLVAIVSVVLSLPAAMLLQFVINPRVEHWLTQRSQRVAAKVAEREQEIRVIARNLGADDRGRTLYLWAMAFLVLRGVLFVIVVPATFLIAAVIGLAVVTAGPSNWITAFIAVLGGVLSIGVVLVFRLVHDVTTHTNAVLRSIAAPTEDAEITVPGPTADTAEEAKK